eukprot:gnl/MRDRNA2_/MRDRNA2_135428_c0_seq1.p1 gnl/MRDRNA2_/MRDRNA2_135428_c0~~gnl/MRDRNA2_/MRDRNA2_135428_c0_seq1.p1  ORF type:complete len:169 (+),score=26.41 gnl/MRDRNA2_/MRDRNA2_135428_c0_seq1:101-607(+)
MEMREQSMRTTQRQNLPRRLKALPAKHTAREIARKEFEATVNRGGGAAGLEDRKGGKAGHAKYKCPICAQQAPSAKSAEAHWDSKHSKVGPFDFAAWSNTHEETGGVTTAGVAIQGGKGKKCKQPGTLFAQASLRYNDVFCILVVALLGIVVGHRVTLRMLSFGTRRK